MQKKLPAAEYHQIARAVVIRNGEDPEPVGNSGVVSAGTADLPVAEEAALTAELMGARVNRVYDVGVDGIHCLLDSWDSLSRARVLVMVAGMEGALASVVGYGAHFGGLAPLLTMLNSCATGVAGEYRQRFRGGLHGCLN